MKHTIVAATQNKHKIVEIEAITKEFGMDIIYQVVARSDYYYAKTRVVITREELQNALYEYTTEVRK